MSHSHEKHFVDTVPDPQAGKTETFWDDDTQYSINPHNKIWLLYRHHGGSASPLVTLHQRDDGWSANEVNGSDSWDGATLAEVLRKVLRVR